MTKSQLNAISYSYSKARQERQIKFIIEHEGSLEQFGKSKYKSLHWYIFNKYQQRVY